MERRAYPRQPLSLEVTLIHGHAQIAGCRVRDFCRGGMFIGLPEAAGQGPRLGRGTLLTIRFTDPRPGIRRGRQLQARVARAFAGGLGVSFVEPNSETLQVLQELASEQGRARRPTSAALAPYLRLAQERIGARLGELFATAETRLFEAAERARSDRENRRYIDGIPALRRSRAALEAAFREALSRRTNEFQAPPATPMATADSDGSLSLVEQDDFEDWLSVSELIARAEFRHRGQLQGLAHRLGALLGGGPLDKEHNPIAPKIILGAFREAAQPIIADHAVRRVLYEVFDEVVSAGLGAVYQEINQALVMAGVLPTLPTEATAGRPRGPARHAAPRPPPATRPPVAFAPGDGVSYDSFAEAYALAASLLGLPAGQGTTASAGHAEIDAAASAGPRPHGQQDLLDAIGSLQSQQLSAAELGLSPAIPRIDLQGALQRVLNPEAEAGTATLGEGELAAVAVTEALINTVLDNPDLQAEDREPLAALALPLLKLTLVEPTALRDDHHPARRMLDRLGRLSLKTSGPAGRPYVELLHAIEQAAHRLGDHEGVFSELAGLLDPLVAVQDAAFARNVERVVSACEGKDRLIRARRRVDAEVRHQFADGEVPPEIEALLGAGWAELLVLVYLRDGAPSDAWNGHVEVLDRLSARLAQEDVGDEDDTLLLAAIDQGLATVSSAPGRRTALLDALQRRLRGDPAGIARYLEAHPSAPAEAPGAATTESAPIPAGQLDPVSLLHVGDWMLFPGRPAGQQRLQLIWMDEDRSSLVFVDHRGVKAVEVSGRELAASNASGRAALLQGADLPLVDRSMYLMVQNLHDKLVYQAGHDKLTGLHNRQELERRLDAALVRAREHGVPAALTYLDLDQFKVINHTCGHQAGDELLQQIGELLQAEAGPGGTVARMGGDEFCSLIENCDPQEALGLAERQRSVVREHRFLRDERHFSMSASIGMVAVSAASTSVTDVLRAADAACFAAKEAGRDRVQVYEADDADIARRREQLEWVARLNKALDHDLLRLRCQRIVPVHRGTEALPHYEVLIGMMSENDSLVLPGQFLPAAEIYSRMGALDRWVVSRMLAWMADSRRRLETLDGFSINLSGHSLNDPGFLQFVVGLLMATKVPASKLCFEITETVAIVNFDRAIQFIRTVRELGCRFALDDFGSGQSSYSYLRNLPVDYLKIDGMFVRDIATDDHDYALVTSINDIAHFMGKRTVAEYVENDAILDRLREIGVDYAQGNGIDAAQPFSEVFR